MTSLMQWFLHKVSDGATAVINTAPSILDFNIFRSNVIQAIDILDQKIRDILAVMPPTTCPWGYLSIWAFGVLILARILRESIIGISHSFVLKHSSWTSKIYDKIIQSNLLSKAVYTFKLVWSAFSLCLIALHKRKDDSRGFGNSDSHLKWSNRQFIRTQTYLNVQSCMTLAASRLEVMGVQKWKRHWHCAQDPKDSACENNTLAQCIAKKILIRKNGNIDIEHGIFWFRSNWYW